MHQLELPFLLFYHSIGFIFAFIRETIYET